MVGAKAFDFYALSWGVPRKPACNLVETAQRKSQVTALSQGGGTYQFETPQSTNWAWGDATFFAADVNGDGRSDYVLFKDIPASSTAPDGAILTALSQPNGSYVP